MYRDIFLKHCEVTGRLDLLAQCYLRPGSNFEGPSWVPDLRAYPAEFRDQEDGFQANGPSPASFHVEDGERLAVTGRICDTVTMVAESADADLKSLLDFLRRLQPANIFTASTYSTGEPFLDAWVRTFVLDLTEERFPTVGHEPLDTLKSRLLAMIHHDGQNNAELQPELHELNNSTRDTWTDMRFFATSKLMGFGPYDMHTSDVVCVLLGLSTPLIVRPAEDGAYRVVGWAYVHGLMDGEALLGPLLPVWRSKQLWVNRRFVVRYQNIETSKV